MVLDPSLQVALLCSCKPGVCKSEFILQIYICSKAIKSSVTVLWAFFANSSPRGADGSFFLYLVESPCLPKTCRQLNIVAVVINLIVSCPPYPLELIFVCKEVLKYKKRKLWILSNAINSLVWDRDIKNLEGTVESAGSVSAQSRVNFNLRRGCLGLHLIEFSKYHGRMASLPPCAALSTA